MLRTTTIETVIRAVRDRFVNLPEGVKRHVFLRRNAYMRRYMTEVYRKAHPQVTVTLTQTQHRQMKSAARRSGRPLAAYLRESAFAYLDQRYLVPRDIEQTLSTVLMACRSIGNNINQITKHVNTQRRASLDDIQKTKALVRQMDKKITHFVSHPLHGDQVDE